MKDSGRAAERRWRTVTGQQKDSGGQHQDRTAERQDATLSDTKPIPIEYLLNIFRISLDLITSEIHNGIINFHPPN